MTNTEKMPVNGGGGGSLQVLSHAKLITNQDELNKLCDDVNCKLHHSPQDHATVKFASQSTSNLDELNNKYRAMQTAGNRKDSAVSLKDIDAHIEYKSGVVYDGPLKDNLKSGMGIFMWPNGDVYKGEFRLNHRHGKGTQTWHDGSTYEGVFVDDKRNGNGVHKWINGETYEGEWYSDCRHGIGKYKWPNTNIYEGLFFMNDRDGYGNIKYSTGEHFIGLYKRDIRYGPGVLKYADNTADVGYWYGDKLIRLLVSLNMNFNFTEMDPLDKTVEIKSWFDREHLLSDTISPQNMFVNRIFSSKSSGFIRTDPFVDKILEERKNVYAEYVRAFEKYCNVLKSNPKEFNSNKLVQVDNITPLLVEIFKHFKKFTFFNRNLSKLLNIDLNAFETSSREKFASSAGLLETSSIEFLNACYERNFEKVQLLKNVVNVDVCDNRGYSPLILAVLRCDALIINYLLDNGANVNHLLDNGLSALIICFIRYYTSDKFLPNIALKHQDPSLTRKIAPNSIVAPNEDELLVLRKLFKRHNLFYNSDQLEKSQRDVEEFKYYLKRFHYDLEVDSNTGTIDLYKNLIRKHDYLISSRRVNTTDLVRSNENNESSPFALVGESTKLSEFESENSLIRYRLDLNEELTDKYVFLMSKNDRLDSVKNSDARLLKKSTQLHFLNEVFSIIELLLRRGADPSLSIIPYPALCFAVAAGDVKIVRLLLEKGADCNKRMPKKYASLTPLCLACGVLGETGPELVKLLLDSLADPNAAADIGTEFLSMCDESWINEPVSEELVSYIGGRTPLHIACMRNDEYSGKIIKLLLEHSANPNVICNGQSPLSLAIASGNKEAVDLLLKNDQCDPNLPLTNGVGSALCAISSTLFEHNWLPNERIKLIDKLIHFGADILQPIAVGPRRFVGTVIDYAYHMYNSDNRLAHTPYHSLSISEREAHNARKNLLSHLSARFREKALERAHLSQTGIDYYPNNKKRWGPAIRTKKEDDSCQSDSDMGRSDKKLFKWCYNCGRSVGVKLTQCSRCKKVFYCGNTCKQKAWNDWHKDECQLHESHRRSRSLQRLSSMKKEQNSALSNAGGVVTSGHGSKNRQGAGGKGDSKNLHLHLTDKNTLKHLAHKLNQQNGLKHGQLPSKLPNGKLLQPFGGAHNKHSILINNSRITINPDYNEPDNYSYN